ncbi:hypothetical protein LJR011_003165 [Agrobacterium tumefaciens]
MAAPFLLRLNSRCLSDVLAQHFAHSSGYCFTKFSPPVMPALSRYPASPSLWAEKTLLAALTRVGWIPAQGRNDGSNLFALGFRTPQNWPVRYFPQPIRFRLPHFFKI